MRHDLKLQTIASLSVLGAALLAEAAAYLLHLMPSSQALWYVNLEVLRPFGLTRNPAIGAISTVFSLPFVLTLFLVALVAYALRHRLIVAFVTNISAMMIAGLIYTLSRTPGYPTASFGKD